jgi:glycosidase
LYQLLTDRFAADGGREIRGLTRTGPAGRWVRYAGGSYDGIVHRLDYLKDLGMSAIWISPIPENSFTPKDGSRPRSDGYHGYWARDFERLNKAFGDEESLKGLLDAAKERDIKVVLDIVLNHSNPTYSSDKGDLYRDGELFSRYFDDRRKAFHHFGDLDQSKPYTPFAWENHNVWGLADLAQENSEVSDYLKEAHARWLALGFDGVRLDTTLHMPAEWIGDWVNYVRRHVPKCDYFFGEWWNGGPHDPVSSKAARTAGIHLTDFGLARAIRGWLSERLPFQALLDCVAFQDCFEEPDLKVNFIDNHDLPRLRNLLFRKGMDVDEVEFRSVLANILLLMWRGVPCIYYGTECGLFTHRRARGKLTGDDPYNREPMRFSRARGSLHGIIRELSRLRKETDLTEHRLEVDTNGTGSVFRRGAVQLNIDFEDTGQWPVAAVLNVDSTILWEFGGG